MSPLVFYGTMMLKLYHCSLKKRKVICAHLNLLINKEMFSQVICTSKCLLQNGNWGSALSIKLYNLKLL
jgi:hypothetical protein